MDPLLPRELDVAVSLAREAADVIWGHFCRGVEVEWKGENDPVTIADRDANELIVSGLAKSFPQDSILSEELPFHHGGGPRLWCVDPMDGTAEFANGRDEFSVMIGLVAGESPVLGVVCRPGNGDLYGGVVGEGCWVERDGVRQDIAVSSATAPEEVSLLVSHSHRNELVDTFKERAGIQKELAMGSVGLKCGALAEARADVYIYPKSESNEWDSCAPEAILAAAGGRLTDCRGEALTYGKENPKQIWGLLGSNGAAHARWVSRAPVPGRSF